MAERVGLRFCADLGKAWPAKESRTVLLEVDERAGGGQGALTCSHTGGDAWAILPAGVGDSSDDDAPRAPLKCNSWDCKGRNPAMNVYLHLQPLHASSGSGSGSGSAASSRDGDGDEPPPRYKLGVLVQHALPQLARRLGGYKKLGLDWVTWTAAAAEGGGGGGAPVPGSVAAATVCAPDAAHWQALEELAKEREQGAGTTGGTSPLPDSTEERALRRAKETLVEAAAFFGPEAVARCSRLTVRKLYNREYHFWDGDKDVADSRRHALEWAVGLAEVEEGMSTNPELRAKLNERLTGPGREQGGGARKAAKRARPASAAAPGGGSRRVMLSAGGGGALSPPAAVRQAAAARWQLPQPLLQTLPLLPPLVVKMSTQQQQHFVQPPLAQQQIALAPQQPAQQQQQQPLPSLLPSPRAGTVGSAPPSFGQFLEQLNGAPSWLSSDLLNQALEAAPLGPAGSAGRSGSGSPRAEVLQPSPTRHDPPVHAERRQRERAEAAAIKQPGAMAAGVPQALPAARAASPRQQHCQGEAASPAAPAAAAAAEPDPLDAVLDAWAAHDRVQRQLAEVQLHAARRQQQLAGLPAAVHAQLAAALQQHPQLAPHAAAVLELAGRAVEAALAEGAGGGGGSATAAAPSP